MATTKISATLNSERVSEAKARVGERGLSRYLDESLAMRLQWDRLADLEDQLEDEFGPIADDARRRVDKLEWPS